MVHTHTHAHIYIYIHTYICTDSCTALRYLNSQNAPFELVSRIMKFVDYRLEKCLGKKYGEKVKVPLLRLRHDTAQCFFSLKVVVTGIELEPHLHFLPVRMPKTLVQVLAPNGTQAK